MCKVEDGKRFIPKGIGDEPGEELSIWSTCSRMKTSLGQVPTTLLQTPGDLLVSNNKLKVGDIITLICSA